MGTSIHGNHAARMNAFIHDEKVASRLKQLLSVRGESALRHPGGPAAEVTLLLAAAGEGAISAGQLGPHRQCSMAVSGPSDAERETGFKENHVGGNDGRSAVPGRVFLPVCRDKRN